MGKTRQKPMAEKTDKLRFHAAMVLRKFQAFLSAKYFGPSVIINPYNAMANIGTHVLFLQNAHTATGSWFASQL
jgi:hypothetical protein